jgi:hypothetical protein
VREERGAGESLQNVLDAFHVFKLPKHLSNFLDKKALFDFS